MAKRFHPAVIVLIFVCATNSVLGGTDADFTTGLDVGSRTGLFTSLYTSPGAEDEEPPQTGVVTSQAFVTPRLAFAVSSRRLTFETTYQIELSSYVTGEEQFEINMFQQAGLHLETAVSRTLRFVADTNGRMGLLDYSRAIREFDPEGDIAPNLPETPEFRFYHIIASMGLFHRLSRRSRIHEQLFFNTRRAFGYEEDAMPFPDYYHSTFEMGYNYAVTRRDELTLNTSGALVLFSPGDDIVPIQLTAGWAHNFSETASVSLSGGAMMAFQLSINEDDPEEESVSPYTGDVGIYWMPLGEIAYRHLFNLNGRKTLTIDVSGNYYAYFDQASTSIRRRKVIGISGTLTIPTDWDLSVRGTLASLGTIDPVNTSGETSAVPIEYPELAALDANVRYRINRDFLLTLGVMASARFSDFGDEDFRARAFEEFIVYLSLSANRNHLEP